MQIAHQATQRGFAVGKDFGTVDGDVEFGRVCVVVDGENSVAFDEELFEDGEVTLAMGLGPPLRVWVVVLERTQTLDTEVQVGKVDQVISRQLSLLIIPEDCEYLAVVDQVR